MIDLPSLQRAIAEKRDGRSLRSVADEIGIDYTALHAIERGRMPSLESYIRLCLWLGVSLDSYVLESVARKQLRE